MKARFVGFILLVARLAAAAGDDELSGGATTAFDRSRNAFTLSARNLSNEHRAPFFVGNSFFNENWLAATASVSDRDGLGPLFVARSCSGVPRAERARGRARVGLADGNAGGAHQRARARRARRAAAGSRLWFAACRPHALPGVKPEAQVAATYEMIEGTMADGEPYTLRRTACLITELGYGPFASNILVSPLAAPAVIGLGLLEAVPEGTLRAPGRPPVRRWHRGKDKQGVG